MPDLYPLSDPQAYLGTGWSFPLRVNVQGSLQLSAADQNIQESIWIILRTSIGERASRPDFGSALADLAFAPMSSDTLVRLCIAVEEALNRWEPRIELDNVRADPDPLRGRVDLLIDYRIVETYETRSLVYPFYLQSATEDLDEALTAERRGAVSDFSLEDW
ncbi:GPW/gp25 family protein [Pantanalinema rosaneae CENA516]|uniref:GPW/gp25 family protein n=1 Tax=Pantanalinema rosaneae TaxID=1620701 RepID=UPI003D6E088F